MAKKKEKEDEVIIDVQEVYSKTEHFIEENKTTLTIVVAAIAIIVGGYFAYSSFYLAPLQEEAQQQMFIAEKNFARDSMNRAIHGDAMSIGFIEIADRYSGTKAGNLANYYLGIAFLRTGEYEMAISALNRFSGKGTIVEAIALGATGDAYLELGDLKKAASYYKKAANKQSNQFSSPIYMMKMAKTYELAGNYKSAVEAYGSIKKEYPDSPEGREIEKYIARAESFIQ